MHRAAGERYDKRNRKKEKIIVATRKMFFFSFNEIKKGLLAAHLPRRALFRAINVRFVINNFLYIILKTHKHLAENNNNNNNLFHRLAICAVSFYGLFVRRTWTSADIANRHAHEPMLSEMNLMDGDKAQKTVKPLYLIHFIHLN